MSKSNNSTQANNGDTTGNEAQTSRSAPADRTANGATREFIVEDIIRRLYSNDLTPGQRLQEPQLAADYAVSRGPIREALYALSAMGLVEIKAQRGAQIRVLTLDEAIDQLLVVQQLIGFAARSAALQDHNTPEGERFKACIDSLDAFPSDADAQETSALREKFFEVLTELAGNRELSRILSAIQVHLIRTQYNFMLREIDPFRARDYKKVGMAVLAREARKSETAAKAHIGRAIEKLRIYKEYEMSDAKP